MPLDPDGKDPLPNADHEAMAQRQAKVLVEHLTDPVIIDKITSAWSGSLDRMVGRGMRRIALRLVVLVCLVAALKSPWLLGAVKAALGD